MIYTEETRMFYGLGFTRPLVATLVSAISEEALRQKYADGDFIFYQHHFEGSNVRPEALNQLLARVIATGTPIPSFVAMSHPEYVAPISLEDRLKLAVRLCELPSFPSRQDYNDGSDYLRARSIIEDTIGVRNIHLEIQERRNEAEHGMSIGMLTQELSAFELGFASSPELRNITLGQLLPAAKSIITALGGPAKGTAAVTSIIALSDLYAHNFEAAFSVALSGVTIALVFRFSEYVDRLFRVAERQLGASEVSQASRENSDQSDSGPTKRSKRAR